MIISVLNGGLGNMMFQIAAGASLAKDIDVDFAYTLDAWSGITKHKINHFPTTIFKNIKSVQRKDITNEYSLYQEKDFSYSGLPINDHLIINGYFQSEKYFSHNREYIKNIFNIIPNPDFKNYTFLHVRRKDYLLHSQIHNICPLSYYEKALNDICADKCIVLSDDIEWCKKNIDIPNLEFSNSTIELEDMSIMISCKNAIIANSTFSWWGAWLSNSQKIVAPKTWFGPQGPKSWSDIYCKDWIVI